jgi:hypothetical protein
LARTSTQPRGMETTPMVKNVRNAVYLVLRQCTTGIVYNIHTTRAYMLITTTD